MAAKPSKCELVRLFAENVRARRRRLGLSQEALAEKAGLHRTYIGMVERSERNVTIYNIQKIAKALEIKAASLITESDR